MLVNKVQLSHLMMSREENLEEKNNFQHAIERELGVGAKSPSYI